MTFSILANKMAHQDTSFFVRSCRAIKLDSESDEDFVRPYVQDHPTN